MKRYDIEREISRVLKNDNCSGCGACALISNRVHLQMDSSGFMRPVVEPGTSSREEIKEFRATCPGVRVNAPRTSLRSHPVFGSYFSVWQGQATDPEVRYRGSSAGVISALTIFTTASGGVAVGVRAATQSPSLTVPTRIVNREGAIRSTGSRYAPVSTATEASGLGAHDMFTGKPCEVSAVRALREVRGTSETTPLLVAFFCAGTPSQLATNTLLDDRLGVDQSHLTDLRYRGNGWPGDFSATSDDGSVKRMSYQESWGQVLGKAVQWRCKICPDGTGQLADIAVGDYWESDDRGYPILSGAEEGRSVVICRTKRGHDALLRAVASGMIEVEPLDLSLLEPVQPLQMDRGVTMMGRIIGTRLAMRRAPRFRGFNILGNFLAHPVRNVRAAVGTFLRVKGRRR